MTSALMLLAGYLVACKVTEDLDAFRPGPPRLADLLGILVPLLAMIVVDLGLAPHLTPAPISMPCLPPSCIVIPLS